jgi:hypothetical protein
VLFAQSDIWREFKSDMTEAGVEPQLIAAEKWFNTLFHSDPALQDITVSALKRNFGRCRECTDIEALVQVGAHPTRAHPNPRSPDPRSPDPCPLSALRRMP